MVSWGSRVQIPVTAPFNMWQSKWFQWVRTLHLALLFNPFFMDANAPTIQTLISRYLQYCEVIRNYSPYTVSGYKEKWALFLKETGAIYPHDLNKALFEDWFFRGRLERKWSPTTFRSYLKYFNMVLKWMVREGYLEENYVEKMEKPRMEHRIPRTLSHAEAILVLDAAFHINYAYTFEKYRNRAIVGIMLLAGLRRKEVMQLKMQDVDLQHKSIFIDQGKGGKDRIIPINSRLNDILEAYLKDRKRLKKQNIYFFIAVQKDMPIGPRCINNLMLRLRESTKLSFSSHTLRHAFARLMLEGGVDIYTLSKIMGHAKITTTTIYLTCSVQQMGKAAEMHSLN